jgi:ArsR family transcriptional regulator, arsenate/arsenite/antimonite-responsive transcriptional repressor
MTDQEFHRIAKVLADPRRFQLLERIAADGEVSCQALMRDIPVSASTMSHHLKELETSGVVESRMEAQCKVLTARPDVIQSYQRELAKRLGTKR